MKGGVSAMLSGGTAGADFSRRAPAAARSTSSPPPPATCSSRSSFHERCARASGVGALCSDGCDSDRRRRRLRHRRRRRRLRDSPAAAARASSPRRGLGRHLRRPAAVGTDMEPRRARTRRAGGAPRRAATNADVSSLRGRRPSSSSSVVVVVVLFVVRLALEQRLRRCRWWRASFEPRAQYASMPYAARLGDFRRSLRDVQRFDPRAYAATRSMDGRRPACGRRRRVRAAFVVVRPERPRRRTSVSCGNTSSSPPTRRGTGG